MTCPVYLRAFVDELRRLDVQVARIPVTDLDRWVSTLEAQGRRLAYAEPELARREREAGWSA